MRAAKSKETGNIRIPFEDRYNHFAFPEPNSGCFIWMGHITKLGYGKIGITREVNGKKKLNMVSAHRTAYEYFVGPILFDMVLDHKCRMRCCVNPDHLEPVTQKENVRRGNAAANNRALAAARTHCRSGLHSMSGDNIVFHGGVRKCRECSRIKSRRRWDKIKNG